MLDLYIGRHKMQSIFQPGVSSIKYVQFQIALWILCLLGTSCSESLTAPEPIDYMKGVQFTVNTPGGYLSPINLRSQTPNECAISEVQVLVFEGGLYKYRAEGTITSSTSTTTTFSAALRICSSEVRLYIVANSIDEILTNDPVVDSNESDVIAAINKDFTSTGINGNFPMFGEYILSSGLDATTISSINSINMLRSIARVDVFNEATNFQICSVQTFRANNSIQVIPSVLADPANPAVTTPSIPTGAVGSIQTPTLYTAGNFIASELYLPEAVAPTPSNQVSSATCIIVGGLYNGSTDTTYYRADFNSGASGHPFGQILRNYLYSFHITAVSGPGRNTPEDAANNSSSSITASITNWDENTVDMSFDGNNYFGVSKRRVTLNSASGSSATINISTNLASYTLQWSDVNGNLTGSPSTNITNSTFSAAISPDGTQITVQALTSNITSSPQIQYLSILADRWKIIIEINQWSPQAYNNTYINILSIGTDIGFLGSTVYGKLSGGNASGILPILTNTANFGPSGKVPIGGIGFDYLSGTAIGGSFGASQCRAYMEQFDIINVTWASNPDATMSSIIKSWLNSKPNRVLFVTRDNSSTNTNLITLLGNGTTMWSGGGLPTVYNFVGYTSQNDYFTKSGPFGAVPTGIGSFTFLLADNTWMGINANDPYAVSNLIPLVVCAISGQYEISVDVKGRIVYIGDSNLYQSNGLNSSGATNYNQAILIANIYAWAINQIILPGKSVSL